MALAHDGTRQVATVDAAPEGVIILTALAAVPDVLRELGVEPGALLAAAGIDYQRGAVTRLSNEDDVARLGFESYLPKIEGPDPICDGAMAVYTNILRGLCGPAWQPTEIALAHGRPADLTNSICCAPAAFPATRSPSSRALPASASSRPPASASAGRP